MFKHYKAGHSNKNDTRHNLFQQSVSGVVSSGIELVAGLKESDVEGAERIITSLRRVWVDGCA